MIHVYCVGPGGITLCFMHAVVRATRGESIIQRGERIAFDSMALKSLDCIDCDANRRDLIALQTRRDGKVKE